MPIVITLQSGVECGHGGRVQASTTAKLTVGSSPVLTRDGVEGKSIDPLGCQTIPSSDASGTPVDQKCARCVTVTGGEASKLTVSGKKVLLATITGTTDGMRAKVTPLAELKAVPAAGKLTAI